MVYGFVKQSGGHIQIYSEPGQGTSVRIYLPRVKTKIPTTEHAAHEVYQDAMPHGSETILVVEDDAGVRRIAVTRLKKLGYRVIEAANGTEGFADLHNHPEISMIFTDV